MWVIPHLQKFTIHFVGSGGQLSRAFDLRSLSYLEHCFTDRYITMGCCEIFSEKVSSLGKQNTGMCFSSEYISVGHVQKQK